MTASLAWSGEITASLPWRAMKVVRSPSSMDAFASRVYSWDYSFSSTGSRGSSSQPVAAREPVGPQSSAGVRPLLQPLPPGSKGGLQASL